MDHQNTIPSQLSPDTIPSVLSLESTSPRDTGRSPSGSWLGWLLAVLAIVLLIALLA